MRSFASIAALGLFALSGSIFGQALSEHAAAAAGATIGTAAGKPVANALGGIFNQVDATTATAASAGAKATNVRPVKATTDPSATANHGAAPGGFSPGFGLDGGSGAAGDVSTPGRARSRRSAAAQSPSAESYAAIPPIPAPLREPSLEDVAGIKVGTSRQDVFQALGNPESHISVPDDAGHLLESCQYWANGKQLGTIRMDNGQVVKVEIRGQ
jgi:hypothetical protein